MTTALPLLVAIVAVILALLIFADNWHKRHHEKRMKELEQDHELVSAWEDNDE